MRQDNPQDTREVFRLLLITNEPEIAAFASTCGVDWIFVDLEIHGKRARQRHGNTVISDHTVDDVARVRQALPSGTLLVRINPWHSKSPAEVEEVIARGADLVMLPMFRTVEEVAHLARTVRGRVVIVPLVETPEALTLVKDVVKVENIGHIHLGLNDLHLALGRRFMFELLSDGTVARAADACRGAKASFGFGGIARLGEGLLPSDLILGEHVRLGSTAAILSRTFHRNAVRVQQIRDEMNLATEIDKLRHCIATFHAMDSDRLKANRLRVAEIVETIARKTPVDSEATN